MTANAAERLLQHYVDNFRVLPWRSPPGVRPPDPYRVWLSEVMLQQTTVAAVIPRFERFVARWPTIDALAAAEDAEVLGEWAGLGYYARARNLIACAREVALRGAFPTSGEELRELPGIGCYTAAAIAAIAFDKDEVAVDTNVRRVVARLRGLMHPSAPDIEAFLRAMMPAGRAGDFTQALMDLGAAVCRPKAPRCDRCPLNIDCGGYRSGAPETFPATKHKAERPMRYGTAWWIERDNHVWLVRRPAIGLLGGMAALPGTAWTDRPVAATRPVGTVTHVFTHFALSLEVERRTELMEGGWWHPVDRLDRAGLPTLFRKAAQLALSASLSPAARLEEASTRS